MASPTDPTKPEFDQRTKALILLEFAREHNVPVVDLGGPTEMDPADFGGFLLAS